MLSEIQERVLAKATACAEKIAPLAAAHERDAQIDNAVYVNLASAGLMAVATPADLGGSAAGTLSYSVALTEIARACPSVAVTMAVTNMVGEIIAAFGSLEQKERYCPILAKGGHGAFALSESDAGSDPGGMRTQAKKTPDGWLISGSKQWISHADTSAVLVVWARTGEAGPKGLSCFLMPEGIKGLSMAKKEDKLGLRGSHTMAINFDDVLLPASALLGSLGGGFVIAMMALDGGRIGIGSQALGIARAARDLLKDFMRHDQPGQQALFELADIETSLSAMQHMVYRAALLKERSVSFSREASMAKLFCSESAGDICEQVYRLVASSAHHEAIASRLLRAVRVTRIYEGTSEIQRVVIARQTVGRF